MRTRKMRFVSALLAVAMMFVVLPVGAFASSSIGGVTVSGEQQDEKYQWKYTVDANNEVTITQYIGSDTSVTIPETIDGKSVVAIGDYAFNASTGAGDSSNRRYNTNCANITSIQINANLRNIGEYAFFGCGSLSTINIPDTVQSIGECAFEYCTALDNVVIPESVTTIGGSAFSYCTNLKQITLSDSIETIGAGAFVYAGLTSVSIPSSVTSIGNSAFSHSELAKVVFENGAGANKIAIGEYAFSDCTKLTTATLSDSIKNIGKYAFSGCTALSSITIPSSVEEIGGNAFNRCSALETFTLLGTPRIGNNIFSGTNTVETINHGIKKAAWEEFRWGSGNIGNSNEIIKNYNVSHRFVRDVSFDLNGHGKGSAPEKQRLNYDRDYAIKPEDPTDDDYKFLGWSETQTPATPFVPFDFTTTKITDQKDTTFYAIWAEKDTLSQANFAVEVLDNKLGKGNVPQFTYDGSAKTATASGTYGDDNKTIPSSDIIVKYYELDENGNPKDGGTTNAPSKVGHYLVKLNVTQSNDYKAAKDLDGGWKFEIVKKTLDEKNFELVGDKKWTEGDKGKNATVDRTADAKSNGVGEVTEVKYYPVNDDGTLGDGSTTLPTKTGKYQIGITVADSEHYEGGELTSDKWQFEIEEKKETPAPNPNPSDPDDNTQKKVTITITDGELYVNGEKKPDGTAEVAEGDTVRIELPEEKKTQGELVFGGWVLGQEELLDALKEKGFAPGAENTEFTVPALPEGTQLTIRAQYVTPEQAGQSDDFISTAAAVVGGAALTSFVAWQGYNIFAEVYMKQFLPVLPENRQELALALWQDAEKPAAVESTLYTDVDEDNTDAQTAARWAVENELLKPADKDDENVFKPYKAVTVGQVYRAWNKAQKLKQQ